MAGSAFTWFLLLALWPVAGWGQDVYRCDSRYSPVACAGAKLKVDDVRTKEQKRDADMSTQKIRTLANAMEKDRLKQEAVLQKRAKPKLTAAARAQKKEEARLQANAKAREKYHAKKEAAALAMGRPAYKVKKPKMFVAKVAKVAKPVKN